MLYPWQSAEFNILVNIAKRGFSALLLKSQPGFANDAMSEELAQFILCENHNANSNMACGTCQSCRLYITKNNPDYYQISISPEQKLITVADIRDMIEFLSLTPNLAKHKVVVISELTKLNLNAANALLKIVEEPPTYARFIFLTENISKVLPTLKSRCLIHTIGVPGSKELGKYFDEMDTKPNNFWLNYYHNAPLYNIEITDEQLELMVNALQSPSVENIFLAVTEFDGKKISLAITLDIIGKWLFDLINLKLGLMVSYFGENYSHDCQLQMINLANKIAEIKNIFYLNDRVNFLSAWANHPLNHKLQVENLLFQYQALFMNR